MSQLPSGWVRARLGDLGNWTGGGTPSKSRTDFWTGGTIPWVSPKDMKVELMQSAEDSITENAVAESATSIVPAGSVLIVVRSGILRHTLPVATTAVPVSLNQDLKALSPVQGILAKYVAWALRYFEQEILRSCTKAGTTVQSVEFPRLLDFEIPLAPLREQDRMVAAIEEHLSELDSAIAGLNRVRTQLPRYRAAVLKAAISGQILGPQLNRGSAEPAAVWLEAMGVDPAEIAVGAPSLPPNWATVPIRALARGASYGTSEKCSSMFAGPPVLRIPNVASGRIDLTELKRSARKGDGISEHEQLHPGDLLVVRTNGSRSLIGRGAVIQREQGEPHLFASYLIRFRLRGDATFWRYIERWLEAPSTRSTLEGLAATTAGQYNLSLSKLAPLMVPIPPREEMEAIVAAVERALSLADMTETGGAVALTRADRLRYAVLRQAFEGRLVPQNARAEPAEDLLKRILAERALSPQPMRIRRPVKLR